MELERVKTGIDGLDKALNGGVPQSNLVLVSGGAGTGKSTLCLQYLINGAEKFGARAFEIFKGIDKKMSNQGLHKMLSKLCRENVLLKNQNQYFLLINFSKEFRKARDWLDAKEKLFSKRF